jgi:GAF domain-containing protein/HAMP domain-containing protein
VVYFEATDIATGDRVNQVVVLNLMEPPWLLAFFQPQEIYLAPIETLANNTILLGLLSGLEAVVLGIGLTQILTRPIMSLTDTAEKVSQGDFDARVEITTEDEIGKLGKTFNTMTVQMQNLVTNLESQVEMRTKSLRNQAAQLRASAEVARDVTSEQNLQDLLDRASNLILDRFGFYHVGIYLNDPKNEYTILTSSMDQSGQRLIQADHRYKINSESNVGYACVLGEPLMASVADEATPLSFHPLLPSSQSELILPLKVGNEILGAMDIHSTNPTSFSDEDVNIFQILADQIAIAIQKAQYQEEIQQTLNELETAYGTFTKESWLKFVQSRNTAAGYKFNQRKIDIIETPSPEVIQAWEKGDQVVSQKKSSHPNEQDTSILAIPMKVRGEVIGVLNLEFESTQIPMDTTELISEIADRLGLILENARLIETAQKQVEREQLTSHITNSIRQSLDMELVLQTAVQEIGKTLGLPEVELRLGSVNQSKISTQPKPNGKQDSDAVRNG